MREIVFKRAVPEEMKVIMELQVAVFEGEQQIPVELICLPGDNFLQWWCAWEGACIAGAVAAWKENEQVHWGRFAVTPEYRGHRIGTQLARYSLEDLFSRGYDTIYMEAREVTVKMVCGMGGKIVGEPMQFYKGTVTPIILSKENYF